MTKSRYSRQTILPEIGDTGQKKIGAASVLCVGAGGLGSPALLYLAAAGVGHIGVADGDTVDLSNLHRQVLFAHSDIRNNKALAAKTRLEALNPDIKITAYPEAITAQNAETIMGDYDIVLDGSDNFKTKFLLNDAALKMGKPLVYGSVLMFEGQAAVFNHKGGPCYRCLFPEAPKYPVMNCAQSGVLGAVAGMIGTAQALEVLKIIVDHPELETLSGHVMTLNAKTLAQKTLALAKDPACKACAAPQSIDLSTHIQEPQTMIPEISAQDAKTKQGAYLLDVREQDEWDEGHIDGAHHAPLSVMMEGTLPNLPSDQEVIIYCRSGQRSQTALQILQAKGYEGLVNMTGGILAYQALS